MCGRFTLAIDVEDLLYAFPMEPEVLDRLVGPYQPRYNIAPTDPVLTYGASGPKTAEYMRWGLIPSWTKPGGRKMPLNINARAEAVATNGMFKESFLRQRCLVLADGFYEWKGKDTPFRIGLKSWGPFGLAAIWDSWTSDETGERTRSCAIITTEPNELMVSIHERMPVVLLPEAHAAWLDPANRDVKALQGLLVPYPTAGMAAYRVSTRVNSVKNQDKACILPLTS